jgi:tetratricopeptide (TPR) repeat protein
MTPYRSPRSGPAGNLVIALVLVTAFLVTPSRGVKDASKPDVEGLTRSGWDHFYSLEYDQAVADFQKVVNARPDDPIAINHLLDAVLYRELYRYNALDTRLYSKQGFLTSKQVPLTDTAKKQVKELTDRAFSLSDKRLKSAPKDVEALYARGTTEGIRATYLVIVEKAYFAGLRSALAARHDHEEVLKLHPEMADAKTVVGAHNFVVGSLSMPVKAMAGVAGIHGDKKRGLEMLAEAGRAGGETNVDARVALALFLRREGQFQEGINVVHTLMHDHPRNFLFALEEGNLLFDAGKYAESASAYRAVVGHCKENKFPAARVEVAQLYLGDSLRAEGKLQEAYQAYQEASAPGSIGDIRQRALLSAGEVSDLLARRGQAVLQYRAAIALDGSSEDADTARKYLDKPYKGR